MTKVDKKLIAKITSKPTQAGVAWRENALRSIAEGLKAGTPSTTLLNSLLASGMRYEKAIELLKIATELGDDLL